MYISKNCLTAACPLSSLRVKYNLLHNEGKERGGEGKERRGKGKGKREGKEKKGAREGKRRGKAKPGQAYILGIKVKQ